AIRFASAKVDSHFMFSVPSKFALWIIKEIGNKIKLNFKVYQTCFVFLFVLARYVFLPNESTAI
ncbi:MAG TPA: hypothetical protein PKX15_11010, partial [Bacteroidales bacterium]|nr:hypothetical protein [Bacteroidales bacterium]